ncbi:hypothetical protein B0T16DRAFT_191244 [Cercophora newfieldiana]|uniref:Uncharacterized protein n=1 Tax=Cercophora newfieldiana TaxID=92897 RepID=A0AA40CMK2_9PEZI|nr:hypothetical protein B0T16DRAFT_191244 [Cercophora newfieldiana]
MTAAWAAAGRRITGLGARPMAPRGRDPSGDKGTRAACHACALRPRSPGRVAWSPCPRPYPERLCGATAPLSPGTRALYLGAGTHTALIRTLAPIRCCVDAVLCPRRGGAFRRTSRPTLAGRGLKLQFFSAAPWVACAIRPCRLLQVIRGRDLEGGVLRAASSDGRSEWRPMQPVHSACPLPTWAGSSMSLIPSTGRSRAWKSGRRQSANARLTVSGPTSWSAGCHSVMTRVQFPSLSLVEASGPDRAAFFVCRFGTTNWRNVEVDGVVGTSSNR